MRKGQEEKAKDTAKAKDRESVEKTGTGNGEYTWKEKRLSYWISAGSTIS